MNLYGCTLIPSKMFKNPFHAGQASKFLVKKKNIDPMLLFFSYSSILLGYTF